MANQITLDESSSRYTRLLRYLTDYIYTVKVENGKAVETYHGPGCVAVTGYTSSDFQEDPDLWHSMVHINDKEAVLDHAEKALSGIEPFPLEHRIIHRDGTLRWVRNSIVLSKDEKGNVLYYDGLINNITDRKRAEHLADLKQRQLIQADKMVALGTMVSGIAHEINNPNNFILLNTRYLQKVWEDLKPIVNEYFKENSDLVIAGFPFEESKTKIIQTLDGIVTGAMRIKRITNSLTDFAKKDTGQLNHDVDINIVVENAILLTGNTIKKSTDNFSVNYNKQLPLIKGNPQQLEQVVINLITNACQSLNDKNKTISVDIGMNYGKNSIYILVQDEGIGIDNDNLKNIFNPFFTTKRDSGGTGLGLYVTYNIVKSHNGELNVSSIKNVGTSCEVILPINGA
jgi:PAS domain S-box-containing protein